MQQAQEREGFNQRFVARLYSLLMHRDENVRRDALLFIGFKMIRGTEFQL